MSILQSKTDPVTEDAEEKKRVHREQPDQIRSIYIRYDNFRYRHNNQSVLFILEVHIYHRNKNYIFKILEI